MQDSLITGPFSGFWQGQSCLVEEGRLKTPTLMLPRVPLLADKLVVLYGSCLCQKRWHFVCLSLICNSGAVLGRESIPEVNLSLLPCVSGDGKLKNLLNPYQDISLLLLGTPFFW